MAEAYDAYYGYWGKLIEKYGENNVRDKITPEEDAENQRLYSDYRHAESVVSRGGFDPMENEEYRSIIIEMNENSKAMKPFHEGWRESHDENVKLVQKAEESGISEEQSQEYYNKAYEASERMMEFGEKLKPYQEKYRELQDRLDKLYLELYQAFNSSHKSSKIPAAPFEKNWHELAMKRMLRLAAEEGYDYVAWTTGEQQADRYSLSQHVSEIAVKAVGDNKYRVVIEDSYGSELEDYRGSGKEMDAKGLSELVGKELATRLITGAEQSKGKEWSGKGKNPEYFTIKGDDLRIGGEGMKGFYDGILVNFMNKYGKKWGIQVEDINLPDLEESARTAHAVRVTPEMKESVLQGQLMFSRVTPEQDKEYLDAVKSGDMAKAQELVNKAAKAAGYTIKAFHGTGAKEGEITVFDDQKDKWSEAPDGTFWFASNKLSADTYNYNTPDDLEETGNTSNGLGLGSTIPVYLKMENPMTYNAEGANWDDIPWGDDYTTSNDMARTARWQGYDGLILKNITDIGWAEHEGKTLDDYLTDDYAVFSPNQIKSAEPVTYDDAGNVIPLSERFNESNPDIRFSKESAGDILDRYENQDGSEEYPWMSESEMIDRIESELPYGINTEEIFSLIDKYRRLDAEDFDEGRRDFSGSERDEVFNDIVDALREYSKGDVRFSKANESQRIFISNAAAAAEAVPMDKATPEQWIKMLSDRGGMKAGEDKWIGLSDWLKNQDRKTITKQEVLDFINQNQIQIEETNYSEDAEYYYAEAIRSYQD